MSLIEELLVDIRDQLYRVAPDELERVMDQGALVVDIRPQHYRDAEGALPGAMVMERNVLEWRLDPTSPDAIAETSADRLVVIVCNEGYASTLAVDSLRRIGVSHATDLEGGYRAWKTFEACRKLTVLTERSAS